MPNLKNIKPEATSGFDFLLPGEIENLDEDFDEDFYVEIQQLWDEHQS